MFLSEHLQHANGDHIGMAELKRYRPLESNGERDGACSKKSRCAKHYARVLHGCDVTAIRG